VYGVALREYLKSDQKPFILVELQYEGSGKIYPNDLELPYHVRQQAWWKILSGSAGHAYGQDAWFFPANWYESYAVSERLANATRYYFFDSIPWWQLVPDLEHQV
jgi:hypothetical protein